jgi:hypothetical protein
VHILHATSAPEGEMTKRRSKKKRWERQVPAHRAAPRIRQSASYVLEGANAAFKGGLTLGSQSYPVEIMLRDSQPNSNRAAEESALSFS